MGVWETNMQLVKEYIDLIIEESLLEDASAEDMFSLLLETVKRRKMNVGGVRMTIRKYGRPNQMKSIKAKLTARRFASKRRLAMRKYSRSAKAKRTRMIVSRFRKAHPHPRKQGVARPHKQKVVRFRRH
jgi:hypothetical protein